VILTGEEIGHRVHEGEIRIDPFDTSNLQPNSYDLELGSRLLVYTQRELDAAKMNPTEFIEIPDEGYQLESDQIYLGSSAELVGSDFFVPIIRARSSIARLGLFVHVTADLIDIGSFGHVTFQLHAVQPIRIYKGMKIAQVTFWGVLGNVRLYAGKYQNSDGPAASQLFKDFKHS
jgi:dCTP deaminase